VTSHPGQLSLAIPSWVGAMSTSQTAMTPCGWGAKAGVVRVWVTSGYITAVLLQALKKLITDPTNQV